MPRKPKRTAAQREADKRYSEKNKKNQRENFKNISATFKKDEAERIAKIFKINGFKTAEIIRGAAAALLDGEPIRTQAEPLIIPQDDAQADGDNAGTDEPPTT